MAWSSTSRGPRFSPSPQASKVRTVLVCWRLGGRAPYQFSSLGPALSFHHHDTADQVPLCLRPVATKPCRIPCFDSRHSLWARGCLLFFVARPPPSCRSCEDPSLSSIEPPERRKARVASPAPLPRCSQLSRPIATAPVESLTRAPNEWGLESVFHLGTPTCQTLQGGDSYLCLCLATLLPSLLRRPGAISHRRDRRLSISQASSSRLPNTTLASHETGT